MYDMIINHVKSKHDLSKTTWNMKNIEYMKNIKCFHYLNYINESRSTASPVTTLFLSLSLTYTRADIAPRRVCEQILGIFWSADQSMTSAILGL